MIPLVDLNRQYKTIKKQVKSAVQNVIDQTDFILGKEVSAFEEEFAKFCQVKYAVGVDSGTGALELAMHALGIKPGDEIIVPVFTFYATASSVASLGAKPVFLDVEDDTGNMDTAKLEQAITSKTRAIIPVHLFGQPVNMPEILKIAKQHNLPIIEDACQAHGAEIEIIPGEWKRAGSIGLMGCFSFYPGKNLGAYGDGGMVVTNEDSLAQKLKLLRDYGRTGKYQHDLLGFNRRLDTIQAAILRVKLKKLGHWNECRRKNGNFYNKLLSQIGVQTFKTSPFVKEVRHVYAIRAKKRDELAQFLKENGIATGVHYPIPLHLQKAFEYLNYKEGDFPVAEKIAKEILSLPIFPELKNSEIKKIVECIAKFNSKI
ncbi:MAG: DegT/DnrJ/EryC1/StrS family aminotransferase [Elusimicrobia bacterium]|nr:DegT/DnrJ/EryC1/StrS family aminotransferase [Elusimicrobiota bacterium]